ncbi:MAG: lysine exporter LysO family protein [Burkholderiaceae bacterium]|nr:lysine exporter LysO family protein [Burkholderiaceae bacterium]
MPLLESLLPILLALAAGYLLGRRMPARWSGLAGRLVIPLVWLLLFLIGIEFGAVITSAGAIGHVLRSALVFALLTTLGPWLVLIASSRWILPPANARSNKRSPGTHPSSRFSLRTLSGAWPPVKEAGIALGMVALGGVVYVIDERFLNGAVPVPPSSTMLLLLIVFVGADLARTTLDRRWFSLRILLVPAGVVIGSLAAGIAAAWLTREPLRISMALSSGYGWFTLSSVLMGKALGEAYGTLALMTDLFRELIAIAVLYALGARHPAICVGNAGATAMDSTLPIIKQVCPAQAVPIALVSGLILSFVAPVLIAALV